MSEGNEGLPHVEELERSAAASREGIGRMEEDKTKVPYKNSNFFLKKKREKKGKKIETKKIIKDQKKTHLSAKSKKTVEPTRIGSFAAASLRRPSCPDREMRAHHAKPRKGKLRA